jgi:predicted nucleic acid-binding protein
MHLVDTSVWVHALRPSGHPQVRNLLRPLILNGAVAVTEWVLLELMTGLRATERKESLLQWFAPVARLPFETSWWEHAWDLAARLRKEGHTPTAADCLIAVVAINHRAVLIHCDADFESMKNVAPLVTLDWTSQPSRRQS